MLTLRSLRCSAIAARTPRSLRALHSSLPATDSSAAPEAAQPQDALAAQAELAAKAKVLSPYHKVSFDERKVRIPWQDGMTSALYVALPMPISVIWQLCDGLLMRVVIIFICGIIVGVKNAFILSRNRDC
jgi:hypothetical protein